MIGRIVIRFFRGRSSIALNHVPETGRHRAVVLIFLRWIFFCSHGRKDGFRGRMSEFRETLTEISADIPVLIGTFPIVHTLAPYISVRTDAQVGEFLKTKRTYAGLSQHREVLHTPAQYIPVITLKIPDVRSHMPDINPMPAKTKEMIVMVLALELAASASCISPIE